MMVIKKWESNYVLDNNCGIPFISYFVYCKHILFNNILWVRLSRIQWLHFLLLNIQIQIVQMILCTAIQYSTNLLFKMLRI